MDNVNYDELFGLETPTEEPTTDNTTQDPAQPEQQQQTEEQAKEEQSREERSRQAFARRIREAEERGARAERARANALIAELDLDDPDNEGQKVSDLDKAAEYVARKRKERFASGTPTEADVRYVAQEQYDRLRQPPVPQNGTDPDAQAELTRQLAQIAKMDPKMTDLGAILQSDIGPAFREYVAKGEDFVTSFYRAKELHSRVEKQAAAAAQAKAASKSHLSSTKQQGEGALPVPADEMALFRELMPGASAEEIQRYYNADRKRFGPK